MLNARPSTINIEVLSHFQSSFVFLVGIFCFRYIVHGGILWLILEALHTQPKEILKACLPIDLYTASGERFKCPSRMNHAPKWDESGSRQEKELA